MDIQEFLTKSKDEHGGVLAFTAGALLALLMAHRRKAHGVIWWLLIGLPGLLLLVSLALVVAIVWAVMFGVTRVYAATISGRDSNGPEVNAAPENEAPPDDGTELNAATEDDARRRDDAEVNAIDPSSIEERLRRLDALHERVSSTKPITSRENRRSYPSSESPTNRDRPSGRQRLGAASAQPATAAT
jgi:hypothetical protein